MNTAKIHYHIVPSDPAAHLFTVSCTIQQPDPQGQTLWLPAWIPGSYMIRDFAKNIVTLQAQDETGAVAVEKQDKQTWRCAPCSGILTVEYVIYAYDLSVRSAHLDTTHGFFNGSSVFLAVQGQEDRPVEIEIGLPPQEFATNWRVATTLQREDTPLFSAGVYRAGDYDELIDHPVELGEFAELSFAVRGTPHHIVVTGRQQADLQRLARDLQRICETQVAVFGELPDMERYIFLLQVVGDGYGGLEHRNSSSLICSRKDLPNINMTNPGEGYVSLLGLFSHEYFHTWNVKRIKPVEFIPYQLHQESYTRQLWAFEGITSYYDDLGLVRSGVIGEAKYLELLGKNITRVLRGSGRLKQSLRDSSFDAWTKFYKQDENASNAIVSYYAKGAMFALALDLEIRRHSNNGKSLDDVMRRLWHEHGKPGVGVADETIQALASEVAGQSLAEFFSRYLDTTEDLPLEYLFKTMGLNLKARVASSYDDAGGTAPKTNDAVVTYNLGARFIADPNGARIQLIQDGGELQRAGFAAYDVIIAINGIKAGKDNLADLLAPYQAGDTVTVHAFRRDELMSFQLALTPARADCYYLLAEDDERAAAQRRHWLWQQHGDTPAANTVSARP